MTTIRETRSQKQQWMLGTTTSQVSFSTTMQAAGISNDEISGFSLSLLKSLSKTLPILSLRINDACTLKGLRGRPAESFKSKSTAILQKQEELCFIQGLISPARQEQQSEDKEPLEEGPFSLVINTNFKTIVGGDISYETSFNCQGEILSWNDLLSASSLDKADFLEISSFRLGFEHFVPSMFGAMIGSTPTIRSRFYLSASPEEIIVSIESDNKASPEFDVNSLAQHIRQACQAANFEIVS